MSYNPFRDGLKYPTFNSILWLIILIPFGIVIIGSLINLLIYYPLLILFYLFVIFLIGKVFKNTDFWKNGEFVYYHKNGNIKREEYWFDGEKVGFWRYYRRNGYKYKQEEWSDGKLFKKEEY